MRWWARPSPRIGLGPGTLRLRTPPCCCVPGLGADRRSSGGPAQSSSCCPPPPPAPPASFRRWASRGPACTEVSIPGCPCLSPHHGRRRATGRRKAVGRARAHLRACAPPPLAPCSLAVSGCQLAAPLPTNTPLCSLAALGPPAVPTAAATSRAAGGPGGLRAPPVGGQEPVPAPGPQGRGVAPENSAGRAPRSLRARSARCPVPPDETETWSVAE